MNTSKLNRDYEKNPLKIINRKFEYPNKEDLYELYITQSLKKCELCEYFKISDSVLKQMLRYYNIKKSKIEISSDELYELYYNKNMSRKQVAEYYNVDETVITRYCRKYGFEYKSQKLKVDNCKKTNINKYGVENVFQSKEIKEKKQQTCLEKYGVNFYQSTDEYKNKVKETKKIKYGDEKYNNIEKNKKTCLEKYGVNNGSKKYDKQEYYEILNSKEKTIQYIQDNDIVNIRHLAMTMGMKEGYVQKIIKKYNIVNLFDYSKSRYEKEIQTIVSSYIYSKNNFKYDKLKEMDIYIPELNLGIEFNGNYWHSEDIKGRNAHINKSTELMQKNIFVYHIFEYEWVNKKEKIISQLNNLLHINKNKIYARKCVIKEVNSKEKNSFLEKNHLQGKDKCNISLGLYYNNILVSIMTFTKPRFNKKYEWELSRYACLSDYNILGGASKLFNYFIKIYNPKNILSYSDISKTRGKIYELLGFKLDHISKPNYVWIKRNDDYKTRYQCQKYKLLKLGYKGKSEIEIMTKLGYYRVFDCGNKVWIWKNE